jgi:hypothetical protein
MVGTLIERRQSAGPLEEIFPQTLLDALPRTDRSSKVRRVTATA